MHSKLITSTVGVGWMPPARVGIWRAKCCVVQIGADTCVTICVAGSFYPLRVRLQLSANIFLVPDAVNVNLMDEEENICSVVTSSNGVSSGEK